MTATAPSNTLSAPSLSLGLPLLAVAGAVLGFVALQLAAFRIAGVFEYPLDDVYIHLAMASGMAGGTYGVNAGEAASAASSMLYPVLLMPFSGTEAQRMLPLVWNLVGLGLSAGLWGAILAQATLPRWLGMGLAALGPVFLNMPGVAFLGMEHSLHAAASLVTMLGLWLFLQDGRIRLWLVAAMILSPLLRLEGLALSLAAAGAIALSRRPGAGVALMAATVAPVLACMAGLMALGLPPLPSSVLTKLTLSSSADGPLERVLVQLAANLLRPAGQLLAVLLVVAVVIAVVLALAPAARRCHGGTGRTTTGSGWGPWTLFVPVLAAMAHLLQAQVGWLHRYEHYIIVTLIAGLALAVPQAGRVMRPVIVGIVALSVLAAGAVWLPRLTTSYLWNPRAVHLQQAQMARFAQDFAREPVAVNDLGRVVWSNPDYVLDLWGLASDRARRIRIDDGAPAGWAGVLTAERGVRLAMVYDRWIGPGAGADWQRLATLTMVSPRGVLGGYEVAFYATDPAAAPKLREALRAFAPTLPADARITIAPASPDPANPAGVSPSPTP